MRAALPWRRLSGWAARPRAAVTAALRCVRCAAVPAQHNAHGAATEAGERFCGIAARIPGTICTRPVMPPAVHRLRPRSISPSPRCKCLASSMWRPSCRASAGPAARAGAHAVRQLLHLLDEGMKTRRSASRPRLRSGLNCSVGGAGCRLVVATPVPNGPLKG